MAAAAARRVGEGRFVAAQRRRLDGGRRWTALAREHGATHVFNAVDPRFVMPIFRGALGRRAPTTSTWR